MTEPFREEIRYEYPELTPESVVLDCGGYKGDFAAEIFKRYGCRVIVLEPVKAFCEACKQRFEGNPSITVASFGISDMSRPACFRIKGDMTGPHADDGAHEDVQLFSPQVIMQMFGVDSFDLLKLNIEGGEFEVLQWLDESELMARFKNIQVQWHPVVPDSEVRRNAIMERLAETYELTWDYGWTWQNWRLKK